MGKETGMLTDAVWVQLGPILKLSRIWETLRLCEMAKHKTALISDQIIALTKNIGLIRRL